MYELGGEPLWLFFLDFCIRAPRYSKDSFLNSALCHPNKVADTVSQGALWLKTKARKLEISCTDSYNYSKGAFVMSS